MKASIYRWSLYAIVLSALLINNKLYSQALSGTYTLPGTINSTTVNNLTQLAALLNGGTVSGTAIFEFNSGYSTSAEVYPITFTQFGGGGNVIIRPAALVTTPLVTSGSPGSAALINLSGVKDISFDGRPGGLGSRIQWAFQNTGNGSSYPTFQFINGASSDTLQYLAVQSSCTNTTPTVLLSTSTVSGGNSNNFIQYDSIGNYSTMPYLAIGSFGTAGAYANAGNSILNNDVYNFQGYYTTYNGAGIYINSTGNGSNWNISNNSFYATSTLLSGCVKPICFLPGSSSTGNTISGNYIGGEAPLCGGTPWKQWGDEGGVSWPPDFIGLYADAGSVAISNNTVQNFAFGGGGADFYYSPSAICMYVVGGSANVSNNLIGSATTANSVLNGWGGLLIGISNSSSGAVTINNNTVANLTQNYTLTAGSEIYSPIMGIYCNGGQAESSNQLGANTITNNKVFNISSIYGGQVENQYYPINSAGSSYNEDGVYNDNPIAGIYLQTTGSAAQTISKNTVYGLNIDVTSGGTVSAVMGIVMNAGSGTNIVNANLVYGLWVPDTYGGSNAYSGLVGIYLPTGSAGTYTVTDNMIDLGFKSTDSSTVQNVYIFGIWDNNAENNSGTLNYDIYHNSIYIGGTYNNTYGNALPSYGIARYFNWGSSVYENVKLYNNIIYNNRSGAAPNYGIYTESAAIDWASNYNLVYGTGTGFNFGNSVGINYATQAAWTTATAMDANTLTSNPQYDSPTNLTPNLHVQSTSPINMAGTASFTIVYDFDSLIRANYTPVDIGAAVVGSCTPVAPTTSISPSVNNICQGTSVNFTTTETNGGTAPTYNFFVNGVSKQSGATSSYSSTTLNNGDSVWVVMTSNAACVSPAADTSSKVVMVVNPTVTPTVTISPSVNNICQGTNVTFTTSETNGGISPTYNFFVNGVSKQNGATSSYSSTTLNNNDSVWVVITSDAACPSPTTGTSAHTKMVVNPSVTPTVSISPSVNNICAGTNVTFTTSETNGGISPAYNFFVDGVSKQNGVTSSYSNSALNNNDSVWVVLTSNATCTTTGTATSAKTVMVVNSPVTPTVSISPSVNNICAGTNVTFTTTETNGGTSPAYNFFIDGVSKQNGATTSYSNNALNNNDSVWVVLTSNASCTTTGTATSTKTVMVINPLVTPTVSISPSVNNICAGTNVTFTTSETNGGASPDYNFFVDGVSKQSGATSSYSNSALNNNDSVWVVLTSNATCATTNTATSTKTIMVINPLITPTVSISPSVNNICAGTNVTFTTSETNGGASPAYNFFVDGVSKQSGATSSYSNSALNNNDSVWVVLTTNTTCTTTGTATSAKTVMLVNSSITPTVSISPSVNNICAGTNVTFTTSETNGGASPAYNFFVDGVSKQSGATSSYSNSALNNNDSVWVVLTSNATCATTNTATSTKTIMVVNPSVTPTVSISPSVNNICAGTNVAFTTSETNGGASPAYNFFVDGVSKQNGVTSSYSNSALNNNDSVWVVLTSNATCATTNTATSTKTIMVINPLVTPTVSIFPSVNNICQGTNVTFTTSETNGGASPAYNFFVDGVSKQSGATSSYSNSALDNNDSVWVVLTSNATCATTNTATSTKTIMVINPLVTPTVSIFPSVNNICQGTNVTFTTSETNGGASPAYNFFVDGVSKQSGATSSYSNSALNNNDSVWVVLTSNATCTTTGNATSAKTVMVVNPLVTPTVVISPSVNNICQGTDVTFTTSETNGGASPAYNFFVNGVSKQNGATSSYSNSALNNNDSVWVVLTSNATCTTTGTATSAKTVMLVNSSITPTVSISPSVNNICAGTNVTFTTSETNGGTSPAYNFFVDGVSKQSGVTSSYFNSTLNNNDSVWVVLTSNATCTTTGTATSAKTVMVINPLVTPTVVISPSVNNICAGTNVTFTTSETNGGASPAYNFFVDGISKQSGATSSYSNSTLNNNDSVWVVLTSNATCTTTGTATSAKTVMVINPLVTPTVVISPSVNNICQGTDVTFTTSETNGGASPAYNFFVNGISKQSGATSSYSNSALNNNDSVWVVLTSNASCTTTGTATSAKTVMVINPLVTPTVSISPSVNNICTGTNVAFTTSETNGGASPAYNFFVNGVSKQNGVTSSYSNSALNNNDSVWVVLTSNASCLSANTATSNHVIIISSLVLVPAVSIIPTESHICQGTPVTFSTIETGGGPGPVYNFMLNGVSVQNDTSATYTNSSLNNNDSVWVVLTSNSSCASPITATSNKVTMMVSQPAASAFSITRCEGTPYFFKGTNIFQTGTYKDTLNTINGCDSIVTLNYTAIAAITINVPDTICRGSSYDFYGQIITTTGNYIDTLIATTGCDSIVVIDMYVPLQPVVTRVGTDTLTTGIYHSYQWMLNDTAIQGATAQQYVAVRNGDYKVAVIGVKLCEDTSAQVILKTLGVNSITDNARIDLYPNPTTGELKINIEGLPDGPVTIRIMDVFGQQVMADTHETISGNYNTVMHLDQLPAGVYFISIQSVNESYTRQVEVVR